MKKSKPRQKPKLTFEEREEMNQEDIENHLEPSTKSKYQSGYRRFEKFCIEENYALVPDEQTLAHFVTSISRELRPETQYPFVDAARNSPRVKKSIRGCRKGFSIPSEQANAMTMNDPWTSKKTITQDKQNSQGRRKVRIINPPNGKRLIHQSPSQVRQIIPEGSSEQKSEELNKASGSRKQVWKETDRTKLDQTKSPIPRPEPSKSSEEILSTVSSQSSKIDGSKSSVESIPTNPNDLESNPAPIERKSVDKQVAEVKPTTSRLWADIVSEPEKEKKVAQSFPEKGKKIVSHRKGKPFEKQNVEVKNTVSPLGSGINSRLRSGSNTKTRASESGSLLDPIPAQQDSEWTEYRQKKGRKGRFLAQKPASRAGVHSEVDRPTPFDVPDGASISNEAGPRSHTPDSIHNALVAEAHPSQDTVVDLTESHSQEATESPSNNINTPYNANPEPNDESSGSGLGASKIKAIIADKIHKPPTKHKGKSRRPKTKAQIGKTEGEGKLDVPNSETTEPQITSLPESETELQQKMDTIRRKWDQADAVHNDLDIHNAFVVPDEASISSEAKTHTNTLDEGSVPETHSQETSETRSEAMSHISTHVPDELINSVSDASEFEPAITGKIKKSRKKQKPKSRKTRPNAQIHSYDPVNTPAKGLASESVKPESLSPASNDKDPAAQLDEILSKALQKDNKRERIRIDFDESSYEKLSKISPLSDEAWSQYRNEFHSDFDNPYEAHRRWNALANQIDQRMATGNWKDLAPMLAEPIKEVALRFKIDKEWPTFDEIDMAYGEETMRMLQKLNPDDKGTLATLFGDKLFRVRLATVYVTSRRSHNAKQFQRSQLVDFMKRGGIVPSLYEIHDCLELKSAGVNWDNLSKEELASRFDRIIKAMTGRISIGDKNLELTKQDWTLSYNREYLSRQGAATNSVDFAIRFKKFADKVNSELKPQSISSWWGIPESERADYPAWATEIITPAQVLAAANFDLTLRWVGMMIHASKQVATRQEDLDRKIIYWPVNVPHELISKFGRFEHYYRFFGFDLRYPI
ncbi:uncharacterized protein MELLADRAFT_68748 [Melampsora larici-populina 98AG31]|uniref:Uncharacterized protein n=1 Tax=Melampsora larici-populina (strain 98AG31 / pathotype 3-4-7) TaxID=747676 RepID=F4S815_MELLP|nr:uncharacterized protein MELLADRAFT_68748 [Melampsora larici-populina 98AG31]EGF99235.1 hypothetical protein MELLADRAFT_68748 [Melampsora larici-populina 98AG31]